jgi:hypothetical protein
MTILQILKAWLCFCWLPLYFDNENQSQANTTSTTENQDNRVVTENGTALSLNRSSGNAVSITNVQTDHGTVDGAFSFARDMGKGALAANSHAIDVVADQSANAIASVKSAYEGESQVLAEAYSTAKAGEQKMFGVAIFALVAFAFTKMRGA